MNKDDKKSIEFTKEQFLVLLKAVYLGNWLANAAREGKREEEFDKIEDYIFSKAKEFGFEKYVDFEFMGGRTCFPTNDFEEEIKIGKFHEEYDEEVFWEEIAERLGERDFFRKYSKEEKKKMSEEERFTKLYECIDAISEELANHGVERLEIGAQNGRRG